MINTLPTFTGEVKIRPREDNTKHPALEQGLNNWSLRGLKSRVIKETGDTIEFFDTKTYQGQDKPRDYSNDSWMGGYTITDSDGKEYANQNVAYPTDRGSVKDVFKSAYRKCLAHNNLLKQKPMKEMSPEEAILWTMFIVLSPALLLFNKDDKKS